MRTKLHFNDHITHDKVYAYCPITSNKGLLHPVTIPTKINAHIPTIAQACILHCLFVRAMLTIVAVPAQPWPD
jgi:hypothetical protein